MGILCVICAKYINTEAKIDTVKLAKTEPLNDEILLITNELHWSQQRPNDNIYISFHVNKNVHRSNFRPLTISSKLVSQGPHSIKLTYSANFIITWLFSFSI